MATPLSTAAFNTLYKKLNASQREAVDTVEGPVMVVAGPGTGKTQILTLRIANILRTTDTPPEGVLALTFTEAAAAHMRQRLVSIIGPAGYRVRIHTFHGYCNDAIMRFPEEFPRIIGSQPITDIEKISILRGIISESTFEHLKPFGDIFYYLNPIRSNISQLKRENISPDKLESYLSQRQSELDATEDLYHEKGLHKGEMKGKYQTEARKIQRTREMLSVYRAYEEALKLHKRYDFEDMVLEVVTAMETKPDVLLRLQEESLYILADEHQDANTAQNRLLELLASFYESPNLFVVGDEKQAIFRFQGASLENFLYFRKKYPMAKIIALSEVYRSGQRVLDAAHHLITSTATEEEKALRTRLISQTGIANDLVELRSFATPRDERGWVASAIRRQIDEGVEPSEIAILYRTNHEAEDIVRSLSIQGILASIESDQNALADTEIRKLIVFIRALAHFGSDERLAAALHLDFLRVSPLDVYKIARTASKKHLLYADIMRDKDLLLEAGVQHVAQIHDLYNHMHEWARGGESVLSVIDAIVRESGFVAHILKSNRAVELIEKLAGLMRDIETLAAGNPEYTLTDLSAHIALLEEYNIPVRKELRAAPRKGSVRLMTAHKSKGLEFNFVYVVNATDGTWGGRREHSHFALPALAAEGSDEDERRLMYVALTRARIGVCVTYASERDGGKPSLPSRLVGEIDPTLITFIPADPSSASVPDIAIERLAPQPSLPDRGFLNELFTEQGLSVTALNNYLQCPWNYFYSNLIRIPKMPNKYMLFGTAVHLALRRYFEMLQDDPDVPVSVLITLFEEAAETLPFNRAELDETLDRGRTFLTGWHKAGRNSWNTHAKVEYRILTDMPVDGIPVPLRLRGDLDKMEISKEGVSVIDYKTGQPKSRNAIQGKTKGDDGGYWRQLVFYKILLDREGKYAFKEGVLDFLQPDARGNYHKETFEVSDSDVSELKDTMQRVAQEIYEVSFWDTRCEDKKCEYCALRELMR